jgi:hypothetical protein
MDTPPPTDPPERPIYVVCEQRSATALAAEVTRLLGQGWRPVGGVAVVPPEGLAESWWYFQAMARGG